MGHIKISQAMKFNGGGHFNHEFFGKLFAPSRTRTGLTLRISFTKRLYVLGALGRNSRIALRSGPPQFKALDGAGSYMTSHKRGFVLRLRPSRIRSLMYSRWSYR